LLRLALACGLGIALACVGAPRLEDPARSGVWGYLRLIPREGVVAPSPVAGSAGGGAYRDRRISDATLVDYSAPGFAVVYVEEDDGSDRGLTLEIRSGLVGLRLEPDGAALRTGGLITVENQTDETHVVSCPAAKVLRALAPGETLSFAARASGEHEIFVADSPGTRSRVFAAPGPFALVDGAGRYELLGVPPGLHDLHVWHPRFPPTVRRVELRAGEVTRTDLEIGVGLPSIGDTDAR
jgi:hypothetical protein